MNKVNTMKNVKRTRYFTTLIKSLTLLVIVIIFGFLGLITSYHFLNDQEWWYVGVILILGIILIFLYYKIHNINNKCIVTIVFSIIMGIILGVLTALLEVVFPSSSILVITITLFVLIIILLMFNLSLLFNLNKKFRYYLIIGILVLALSIIALSFLMYAKLPYCHPLIIILEFVLIVLCIIESVQTLTHIKKEIEHNDDESCEWLYAANIVMMIMMTYVEILKLMALLLGSKKKSN